ncbi:MAG: InlB B-repeat-containing protein [Clostridia bacterium]|nr:InlB B-repeat-containing protein [Clostridia bacterium]
MAIRQEYGESIVCMTCGSANLSITHSPMGIEYCTCKQCGRKFVVQTTGEDFLDKYMAARGRFFTELEKADFARGRTFDAKKELDSLVSSYAVLAEIDTIYYWYKIVLLTDNFTNYSRLKEAEKEYLKIPKDLCYFISGEDIVREQKYKKQYDAYISHLNEEREKTAAKKRKKKKAALGSVIAVLLAALIGAGAFVYLYDPSLTDTENGITVYTDNSSFGLIGKFGAKLAAAKLADGEDKYAEAAAAMEKISGKFVPYSVSFGEGNETLKNDADAEMLLPESYLSERVKLYTLSEDGKTANETEFELNGSGDSIRFKIARSGIYILAEAPCRIKFDTAGGDSLEDVFVVLGGTLGKIEPERKGYTFDGFYVGSEKFDVDTPINDDMTLSVRFTPKTYTVSYYFGNEKVKTQQVTYDEDTKLYVPVREGYVHKWYRDGVEAVDGIWKTDSDVRLDGEWTAVRAVVTFDNGFQAPSYSAEVAFDASKEDVEVPHCVGYVFGGYYTGKDGAGDEVYASDGKGSGVWKVTEDTKLYAKWTKDSAYSDFTYIETESDLTEVRADPSGKFLLVTDLDLGGASWTPLPEFAGTFDGGGNAIYNYTIEFGVEESGNTFSYLGLFSKAEGTIKNLQVGKEGYTTSVKYSKMHRRPVAGLIVGEIRGGGKVENCRAINCSIDVFSETNKQEYRDWDWNVMAGSIAGSVKTNSVIRGCYAENCDISVTARAQYNKIDASPWAGGIVGQASSSTVADCYAKDTVVSAHGIRLSGGLMPADNAQPRAGGIIGRADNTAIERCVVYGNTVSATGEGGSNRHWGSIIGETSNTRPLSLFGIDTNLQCSGSNTGYANYKTLSVDSYADLVATDSSFENGYWIDDDGKIALNFDEMR